MNGKFAQPSKRLNIFNSIHEKSRGTEIAFYQNSFVISPDLLYHLIRRNNGRFANEAIASNPIVSSKQWLNSLKLTNWK